MKKKMASYILLIVCILAIFIVYLNLDKIKFTLSMLQSYKDTKNIEFAENKAAPVPKAVENPFEKIIKEENSVDNIPNNEDKKIVNDTEDKITGELSTPSEVNTTSNEKKGNTNKPLSPGKIAPAEKHEEDTKADYKTIVEKYNDKFSTLNAEFEKSVESLINEAINDYNSGEFTKTKLANKYLNAGTNLERSADNEFYALLRKMENELKKNSYDTSFVRDVANYYESSKLEKKSSLLNEGMKVIGKSN